MGNIPNYTSLEHKLFTNFQSNHHMMAADIYETNNLILNVKEWKAVAQLGKNNGSLSTAASSRNISAIKKPLVLLMAGIIYGCFTSMELRNIQSPQLLYNIS